MIIEMNSDVINYEKMIEEAQEIEKLLIDMGATFNKINVNEFDHNEVKEISFCNVIIDDSMYDILVKNNGIVSISKLSNSEAFEKNGQDIYFEANYDINSDNFNIGIAVEKLSPEHDGTTDMDLIYIARQENKIVKMAKDVKISRDLSTGRRWIDIKNKNLYFNCILNPDNSFKKADCYIKSHWKNGSTKFCYLYELSENFGLDAEFYHLLTKRMTRYRNEPFDLDLIKSDARFAKKFVNSSSMLANNFIDYFIDTVVSKVKDKKGSSYDMIEYDVNDFNTSQLNKLEDSINNYPKLISNQLLLNGLYERLGKIIDLSKNNSSTMKKVLKSDNK